MKPLIPILLLALVTPALAEAPQPTLSYDAAFFAGQNPKTALDMVNWLPGFTFQPGDPTVRGFAAAAGNVLIDGARPADKQFTLDQVLERIPASQVDHIEIIRGAESGVEMFGQPVVANVVRKARGTDSRTLTLSNAQFWDGREAPSLTLEGTHHSDGGGLLTGALYVGRYVTLGQGKGMQDTVGGDGSLRARETVFAKAGGLTAFGNGAYETPLWLGKLRLNANVSWTDYYDDELDLTSFPSVTTSSMHAHLGGPLGAQMVGEMGANFSRDFSATLTSENVISASLRGQDYASELSGPGLSEAFGERDHGGEMFARSDLRKRLGRLALETSLEGAYNWLDTDSFFSFGAFPIALPNARARVSELRGNGALNAIWTVSPTLQLEAGLTMELTSITSDADARQHKDLTYPRPRLALTYTPDADNQIRLRAEREVGQLDFANFVASSQLTVGSVRAANTYIVPQQDYVFEAAYERHLWSDSVLVVTVRHYLISDAIDRVPVINPANPGASFDAPGNIGGGIQDSAILDLTTSLAPLGLDHSQLKLDGTFQWSRVSDPTTGLKRPISGINPREYSLTFRQDVPARRAAWGASLVTPCWDNSNGKDCSQTQYRFNEIDAYKTAPALGLFGEYLPWPGTTLRLEADNILGAHYNSVVSQYAGPRNLAPLSRAQDRRLASSPSVQIKFRQAF